MAQITLRVPDDLLDRIEEATGPETSRSEWLRDAARDRLDGGDGVGVDFDELHQKLDHLEERVDDLEAEHNRHRLLGNGLLSRYLRR